MNFRLFAGLLLCASVASAQTPLAWPGLSREEQLYAERLRVHADLCTTLDCRSKTFELIFQAIVLRRSVSGELMSAPTASQLKRSCDGLHEDLQATLECLRARQKVSWEDGMRLAGYTKAGVTRAGYDQIRIGMDMRDVEYILDDFGEEVSYASSGGYSAATYKWAAGRRLIIVSFSNYQVSGRSHSGL